jgi:hypothetical protein
MLGIAPWQVRGLEMLAHVLSYAQGTLVEFH